jgi:hypothetical protein
MRHSALWSCQRIMHCSVVGGRGVPSGRFITGGNARNFLPVLYVLIYARARNRVRIRLSICLLVARLRVALFPG